MWLTYNRQSWMKWVTKWMNKMKIMKTKHYAKLWQCTFISVPCMYVVFLSKYSNGSHMKAESIWSVVCCENFEPSFLVLSFWFFFCKHNFYVQLELKFRISYSRFIHRTNVPTAAYEKYKRLNYPQLISLSHQKQ